jgi:hypothetical protein
MVFTSRSWEISSRWSSTMAIVIICSTNISRRVYRTPLLMSWWIIRWSILHWSFSNVIHSLTSINWLRTSIGSLSCLI